jgi:hypothetical protein
MSNPAAYDELIHALSDLESNEFLEEMSERLGETVKGLIDEGFQSNITPYGETWAPRRSGGSWPLLEKSGEMRASFHIETNAAGVKATNPVEYASYQNYGTRYISARAMLPDGSKGLGEWEEPLRASARETFNQAIKGSP